MANYIITIIHSQHERKYVADLTGRFGQKVASDIEDHVFALHFYGRVAKIWKSSVMQSGLLNG